MSATATTNGADIVRWTLNALIAAEELGVTSANIDEMAAGTNNPEINRLLGTEGDLGEMLGLDADWAKNAIAAGGNYGEIFEKNIGEETPIGLARGLNAQWTDGGLLYTPAVPLRTEARRARIIPRPLHHLDRLQNLTRPTSIAQMLTHQIAPGQRGTI